MQQQLGLRFDERSISAKCCQPLLQIPCLFNHMRKIIESVWRRTKPFDLAGHRLRLARVQNSFLRALHGPFTRRTPLYGRCSAWLHATPHLLRIDWTCSSKSLLLPRHCFFCFVRPLTRHIPLGCLTPPLDNGQVDAFRVDGIPHLAMVNGKGEVETAIIGAVPKDVSTPFLASCAPWGEGILRPIGC